MQIVIPNDDPLVKRLRRRALQRGLTRGGRTKKLPILARELISDQLAHLETNGDPKALKTPANVAG